MANQFELVNHLLKNMSPLSRLMSWDSWVHSWVTHESNVRFPDFRFFSDRGCSLYTSSSCCFIYYWRACWCCWWCTSRLKIASESPSNGIQLCCYDSAGDCDRDVMVPLLLLLLLLSLLFLLQWCLWPSELMLWLLV